MKHSTFKLFSYLINILLIIGMFYFDLPLWAFLFLIPANTYLQIYASQQYSFRNSMQLEAIPEKGYEQRIYALNANEELLHELGFTRFDEFYLQTSTDVVVYAYKHSELPVILCQYHYEIGIVYDLDTRFQNGFTLTTANSRFSGLAELRPAHLLMQAFPELSVEDLFNRHLQSLRFLEKTGFVAEKTPIYNFRQNFLDEFLQTGGKIKGLLSPVKVIYLMYFGNQARFTKTIQEQVLANQLQLPEKY